MDGAYNPGWEAEDDSGAHSQAKADLDAQAAGAQRVPAAAVAVP
jgi:hypothetical protein